MRVPENRRQKKGPQHMQGPLGVKVKTSRGEQLLRWRWEEEEPPFASATINMGMVAKVSMALPGKNAVGGMCLKSGQKKRATRKLGPFIVMKVIKPPEGNSCCGGTGRKKATKMHQLQLICWFFGLLAIDEYACQPCAGRTACAIRRRISTVFPWLSRRFGRKILQKQGFV